MKQDSHSLKVKLKYFLLDHPKTKFTYEYVKDILITLISAFLYAYAFRAFTAPEGLNTYEHLISGGASGSAQILVRLVGLFNPTNNPALNNTLQSVFYFGINIPLFFFAWFKVGKRFALFTLMNVGIVSLFTNFLPESAINIIDVTDNVFARALFAGIFAGISSSMAMRIGSTNGGTDVIAFYVSEKKSTSAGKFSLYINIGIIAIYVLLTILDYRIHSSKIPQDPEMTFKQVSTSIVTMALFTSVYFFSSSKVIDTFHTKNKKTQLQIFTTNTDVPTVLIRAFPHSCTIVDGKGAFTGGSMKIIYMVVSHQEVKKAVSICRQVDPNSFVTVIDTYNVYGKFYKRPIK